MFDVGYAEVFFLILVGVIVLGPERLPGVAKTLAKFTRRARRMAQEFQHELEKEVDLQEIKKIQAEFSDAAKPLKAEFTEAAKPLKEAAHELRQGNSILDRSVKSLAAGSAIAASDAESQPASSDEVKGDDPSASEHSADHSPTDQNHSSVQSQDDDQKQADVHKNLGESVAKNQNSISQAAHTPPAASDSAETPDPKTSPS